MDEPDRFGGWMPCRASSWPTTAGWWAWRLLVDDREIAEDVVQEAFVGLHRRWGHLRDPGSAVTYLNKAVVNGGRDRLRHGRRVVTILPRMVPVLEEVPSAEQDAVRHDEAEHLWQAITALPTGSGRCWSCATTSSRARPRSPTPSRCRGVR